MTGSQTSLQYHKHSKHVPWKVRMSHFTWAWFECTMSTGAIATLLGQQPFYFTGLKTIGKVFFILDLVLFLTFSGCIAYRFCTVNRSLNRSLHHPHESFYFGSFFVSIALILYCMEQYAVPATGPWMVKALEVLFWIFAGVVMLVAIFQYHVIFDREKLPVKEAMPAWILPVYPFLVLGVLGSTLLNSQPKNAGLPIFIGSIAFQGLGFTIAFFMLTIYFTRLVKSELPEAPKRPGMYVAVGPAAYTANTLVALGLQAPYHIPDDFLGITSVPVGDLFKAFGVATGIFIWLVAFWFFALTTVSVLISVRESHFTLNYWAFIFPNVGLTIALIQISKALQSSGIKGVCSAATIVLVIMWLFAAIMTVRGVLHNDVLWPGMDEDMEEMEQNEGEEAVQDEEQDSGARRRRTENQSMEV